MLVSALLLGFGMALMAIAGDLLVRGAISVGARLGISALFVGIFIIGFGTSAPEMIVSLQSGLQGIPDMALGNIVGSNIANILLVLAIPAILCPIKTAGQGNITAGLWVVGVTVFWFGFALGFPLTLVYTGVGVIVLLAYLGQTYYSMPNAAHGVDDKTNEGANTGGHLVIAIGMCLFGLIVLPVAAHLVVQGGAGVASGLGVSDEIIGLTLLAVGTSLPEIGAGIAAAIRGRTNLILGNILGSNLLNILGSGAIISAFGPVEFSAQALGYSHWILLGAALMLLAYLLRRRTIGRFSGVVFLGLYAAYVFGIVNDLRVFDLTPYLGFAS